MTRQRGRPTGTAAPNRGAHVSFSSNVTSRAAQEDARRAARRSAETELQLAAAISQLEQAHVELHRRSEALRQKTRTLYLVERALVVDNEEADPFKLVDGLLALVGDDMQAQRCSLMLRAPESDALYIAALRGLAPHIAVGSRIPFGKGVAGSRGGVARATPSAGRRRSARAPPIARSVPHDGLLHLVSR